MDEETVRLGLPLLEAGQAQKEITHNEALAMVDVAIQAAVDGAPRDVPPDAPAPGACWIVGAAPQGAWSGRANCLAGWTSAGWRFVATQAGWRAWDLTAGQEWRRTAAGWERGVVRAEQLRIGGQQVVGARRPAIAAPSGGAQIDTEARAVLTKVLDTLRQHGLIEG